MAMRLGEVLQKQGLITESQLNEALRAQQLFGGRLGTNLVELGFITEQALAKVLSVQLGLPAIGLSELDSISADAIAALPRNVVEKHKVVPLQLVKRKLRLAMSDPTDLKAIDEVTFVSNCTVSPVVAPEMLVSFALEKYYGIARATRYIKLQGPSDVEFQIVQTSAHPSEESSAGAPAQSQSPGGAKVQLEDRGAYLQQERKEFLAPAYSFAAACRDLATVAEQREVFDVLKRYLAQDFQRLAIFVMRATSLVGWSQVGCAIDEGSFRKLTVPPGESGVFTPALEQRAPFLGQVRQGPVDEWLMQLLGGKQKRPFLVLPVVVNGQVVSVVVADERKRGTLEEAQPAMAVLGTKLSYALQAAYLRKRILEA
jgi:hypothetical protein